MPLTNAEPASEPPIWAAACLSMMSILASQKPAFCGEPFRPGLHGANAPGGLSGPVKTVHRPCCVQEIERRQDGAPPNAGPVVPAATTITGHGGPDPRTTRVSITPLLR
jgi:hypothetical protein